MKMLSTYEVQFTTTSEPYKTKLLPFKERVKQIIAENKEQALKKALNKLLRDFPESQARIWQVKQVIKRQESIQENLQVPLY